MTVCCVACREWVPTTSVQPFRQYFATRCSSAGRKKVPPPLRARFEEAVTAAQLDTLTRDIGFSFPSSGSVVQWEGALLPFPPLCPRLLLRALHLLCL